MVVSKRIRMRLQSSSSSSWCSDVSLLLLVVLILLYLPTEALSDSITTTTVDEGTGKNHRLLQQTTTATSSPVAKPVSNGVSASVPVLAPTTTTPIVAKPAPDVTAPVPVPTQVASGTTTGTPTATVTPTYSAKCYICGDENAVITIPNSILRIGDSDVTCQALDQAGRSGLIPPEACDYAKTDAGTVCGCTVATPIPKPTLTPRPTTSAIPTRTASPNIIPLNEPCYVCGNENKYISNVTAYVELDGRPIQCSTLDTAARSGIFSVDLCPNVTAIALDGCGNCSGTAAPTPLQTFIPTISPQPTTTTYPTYSEKCYICGSSDFTVDTSVAADEILNIGAIIYSCNDLHSKGLARRMSPGFCTLVQDRITETAKGASASLDTSTFGCTCVPNPATTAPDSVSDQPSSSKASDNPSAVSFSVTPSLFPIASISPSISTVKTEQPVSSTPVTNRDIPTAQPFSAAKASNKYYASTFMVFVTLLLVGIITI